MMQVSALNCLWARALVFTCLLHMFGLAIAANSSTCPAALDFANATGTSLVWDTYMIPDGTSFTWSSPADAGVLIHEPLNTTAFGTGHNISYSVAVHNSTLQASENASYPVLERSVWVGQPPGIDLYSGSNLYSACAIVFSSFPNNTNRLGQDDNGNCEQTLSSACIDKLTKKLATFAQYQVAMPATIGPYNNLTNADGSSMLPAICSNIAGDVGGWNIGDTGDANVIPSECQPYMYSDELDRFSGPPVIGVPLTFNVTPSEDSCSLRKSSLLPEYTLRKITYTTSNRTGDSDTDMDLYDKYSRSSTAVLTVIFPPANSSRQGSIGNSVAFMSCIRPTRFSEGSRVSPALPAGTQISSSTSQKQKIGIGVGVAVGVLALIAVGVGAWFCLRRRRRRRGLGTQQDEQTLQAKNQAAELSEKQRSELLGGGGVHEMKGSRVLTKQKSEGDRGGLGEMQGSRSDWELEGQAHHDRTRGSPQELPA